jgi:hypothetical protein
MAQFYTDPSREAAFTALPDAETFTGEDGLWYWWPCFPGCLPDGDPEGPFDTEEEAMEDARQFNDWCTC